MITVSVKKLVSAMEEADAFHLSDMNEGTCYIYDEIYKRLSKGIEVRLSEINFSSFEFDDIDTMRDLYFNTLEINESKAEALAHILRNIPPVAVVSEFI